MKVLFFDIDGVLNRHEKLPSGVCGITPELRDIFNDIIDRVPGLKLVVHSSWRYLVTYDCPKQGRSSMTLDGFAYLLNTHGIKTFFDGEHNLIGTTAKDVYTDGVIDRPERIGEWLCNNPEVTHFAILDDLKLAWGGKAFFHTPDGLTQAIADSVVALLNDEVKE